MSSGIGKKWRVLGVVGALCVPGIVTAALSLPFSFKAGDPIKADEVNANFEALRARLDALSATPTGASTRGLVGTLTLEGVLTAVPIRSFTESIQVPGIVLGAGSAAPKPVFSDVQVIRDAGDGTPFLDLTLNQQKKVPTADIVVGNLSVHLTDVIVSDVAITGVQAGRAQETISLSFSAVQWTWQDGTSAPAKVVSFDRVKGLGSGGAALPPAYAYFAPGVPVTDGFVPISGYTHDMGCATPPCKVAHGPVSVQKLAGPETLDAFGTASLGKHTTALGLTWFTAPATASHSLSLTDVLVSNVALATNNDGTLSETDGFSYSAITWVAGKTQAGWDVLKNAAQ